MSLPLRDDLPERNLNRARIRHQRAVAELTAARAELDECCRAMGAVGLVVVIEEPILPGDPPLMPVGELAENYGVAWSARVRG